MTSIGTTTKALGALLLMATLITGSGQPLPKQDSDYTPAANSQVVSWQVKRVPPPSALYVNVDDKLVVFAASSQASEVVTVNYRLLRAADAKIVAGQLTVAPGSNRGIVGQTAQLAEGFLLSVSVTAAAATTRGQTFVRIFLGAGPFGAGQPSYMLMSDYATNIMAPAHPNGRVLSPVEGPGNVRLVTAIAPGAGSDFLISVPANARWRLQTVQAELTTSAVVGNRLPALQFFESSLTVGQVIGNVTQTAGVTEFYTWAAGVAVQSDAQSRAMIPLPVGFVLGGPGVCNVRSGTAGLQGNDQWGAPTALVEEWLDNV